MYISELFEQHDPSQLYQLIRDYPLGTLLSNADDELNANLIPFYLDASGSSLRCHVARANSVWKVLDKSPKTLIVFQGPQAYISPNWYPSKQQHGQAVPTWNYTAVYIRGEVTVVQDHDWLMSHIRELSKAQEASQAAPWQVDDAPQAYIDKMCRMIVGLENKITDIKGVFKTSQNKSPSERAGVVNGLEQEAQRHAPYSSPMASLIRSLDD